MLPAVDMLALLAGSFIALATYGGPLAAQSSTRDARLHACELAGLSRPARCGALEVPENPDRPDGRKLSIQFAVVPAAVGKALADPLVVLMGGPGEEAITSAAYYASQFATLLNDRDLVLIDQRGTGRSGALHCDLFQPADPAASLRDLFPVAAVEKCEQVLSSRADLSQYTFARFASDLEGVRRALGYGRLNLFSGSYGTRAAQVFLRTFPKSVRTAFLHSVVPIDVTIPLPFAKASEEALQQMFEACALDRACHAAYPNLRDEFREVSTRLETGAVRVSIPGRADAVPISRGRVAEWFRSKLYRPKSAVILPWIIHRAFAGDWSPLAESMIADAREYDTALSFGLFFSIVCSEDVAFVREEEVVARSQSGFLGDYRVRQQQTACQRWPRAALPRDYRLPVRSSVPALFVSGDADGGTPLWFMEHAVTGFSNVAAVVARGQGHTEWSDCVAKLYERFVRSGSAQGLEKESCEPVAWPAFKIASETADTLPRMVIKPLLRSSLSGDANREVLIAAAELPPGATTGIHTHPGDEYATLLEGELELLVDGKAPRRLGAGEAYHNARDIVHETRNSGDRPAKIISTFVIDKGAPVMVPVPAVATPATQ